MGEMCGEQTLRVIVVGPGDTALQKAHKPNSFLRIRLLPPAPAHARPLVTRAGPCHRPLHVRGCGNNKGRVLVAASKRVAGGPGE